MQEVSEPMSGKIHTTNSQPATVRRLSLKLKIPLFDLFAAIRAKKIAVIPQRFSIKLLFYAKALSPFLYGKSPS